MYAELFRPARRCLQNFLRKIFSVENEMTNLKKKIHQLHLSRFYYISRVSFIFGAITMTAGIIGVPLGSYLSTRLSKTYPRSDPVICAIGLLVSAPLIGASMIVVTANSTLAYLLVFLGEVALNCNWAIVADMLLVRLTSFALIVPSNFLCSFHSDTLFHYFIILQKADKNHVSVQIALHVSEKHSFSSFSQRNHTSFMNASTEMKWSW